MAPDIVEEGLQLVIDLLAQNIHPIGVVAVDGHSAAGKSTFASTLADRIGAVIVRGDDFYRVLDHDRRAALAAAQGVDLYYDWQRLRDQALRPLKAGTPACFRPYDWDSNSLADHEISIGPAESVVVEGLFVGRPELAEFVDVTVLVTSSPKARRWRQAERADATSEWLELWDAAETWYFDHVRPPTAFDVVIDQTSPFSAGTN